LRFCSQRGDLSNPSAFHNSRLGRISESRGRFAAFSDLGIACSGVQFKAFRCHMVLFAACRCPLSRKLHGKSSELVVLLLYWQHELKAAALWNPRRSSWLTGSSVCALGCVIVLKTPFYVDLHFVHPCATCSVPACSCGALRVELLA
jgi:hypothetical protein